MLLLECFAAVGFVSVLWALLGWLLRPRLADSVWFVVPCRGDGGGLEETLRAARYLHKSGCLTSRFIMLDQGLNEQGRRAARLLQNDNTVLLRPEQLEAFWADGTVDDGRKGASVRNDTDSSISES